MLQRPTQAFAGTPWEGLRQISWETSILSVDSQCTLSSAESDIQVSTEIPDIQLDSSETSNIRIPSSLHALANSFGSAEKHTPAGRGCLSYCLNTIDCVLGSFKKVCGS